MLVLPRRTPRFRQYHPAVPVGSVSWPVCDDDRRMQRAGEATPRRNRCQGLRRITVRCFVRTVRSVAPGTSPACVSRVAHFSHLKWTGAGRRSWRSHEERRARPIVARAAAGGQLHRPGLHDRLTGEPRVGEHAQWERERHRFRLAWFEIDAGEADEASPPRSRRRCRSPASKERTRTSCSSGRDRTGTAAWTAYRDSRDGCKFLAGDVSPRSGLLHLSCADGSTGIFDHSTIAGQPGTEVKKWSE